MPLVSMRLRVLFIVVTVLLALALPVLSSKVSDQIYSSLDVRGCFRRATRLGSTGCGSIHRYGDTGVLRLVNDTASLDALASFRRDFIAVVTAETFTRDTLSALSSSRFLRGVLLLLDAGSAHAPTAFSPLPKLPWNEVDINVNADMDPYEWLPDGNNLQREALPVAMSSVSGADAQRVLALATANEAKGASGSSYRHRARMNYFMSAQASDTSQTCLADRTCLPLGGYSAWAAFGNVTQQREWVLATLPLDGHSLFDSRAYSARNTAAPLAAWLGAAHALGRVPWRNITASDESTTNSVRPVVFAALNGEQWSRAGSRAFVQDVKVGDAFVCNMPVRDASQEVVACMQPYRIDMAFRNMTLTNLTAVLELGSLASPTVYTHTQPGNAAATELAADLAWVAALPATAQPVALNVNTASAATPGMPPSASAQAFLAADRDIPAVLLADFDAQLDPLYGSAFDSAPNAGKDRGYNHLCAASTVYARTLALRAGVGSRTDNVSAPLLSIEADCDLVWELTQCFLRNGACPLLNAFSPTAFATAYPGEPTFYSGVYRPAFATHIRGFPRLVHDFLAAAAYNATRVSYPTTPVEWLANRRWAHFHDGLAPEFELDFDKDIFVVKNGPGLAWTSSNYGDVGVVTFQAEDGRVVLAVGIAGAVVCALAGVVGLLLMKVINYHYDLQ